MITIAISGPRAAGKTTTAIAIARLLRLLGQTVRVTGYAFRDAKHVDDEVDNAGFDVEHGDHGFTTEREFEVIDNQGEPTHGCTTLLEEKVKELMAAMHRPKREISQLALIAKVTELAALAESASDVEPAVFAQFPAEIRAAGFSLMLSIIAATLEQ
jgi:cytidylate kinase